MKNGFRKIFLLCTVLLASAEVCAKAKGLEELLCCDFTAPVLKITGKGLKKAVDPVFARECQIGVPEHSVVLKDDNFITIPESNFISLRDGGTLHFTAFFFGKSGRNYKNPGYGRLDMVFFKNTEFLLGRNGDNYYFNLGDGKGKKSKWLCSVTAPSSKINCWQTVTVTVHRTGKSGYIITMYINGKKVTAKTFHNVWISAPDGKELVTLGKGWGGPWFMNGKIAFACIYEKALSEKEVQALFQANPYGK